MSRQLIEDNIWKSEIPAAEKYRDERANVFECDTLEKYYEGRQWKSLRDDSHRLYVINKIYENVQIKIDDFIPQFPHFLVQPRAGNSDYNQEFAIQAAQLDQDILNSIIGDDFEHFKEELGDAYRDSFFRFGIVEVGYSADWILNPNAPKPLLESDTDKDARYANTGQRPKRVNEPKELPVNERVYYKHIPAKKFVIGGLDHKYLNQCTWCGYYEYAHKDDILAIPGLMNFKKLSRYMGVGDTPGMMDKDKNKPKGDYYKVWHLWHNKAGLRIIFLWDCGVTIYQRPFKFLNLYDYRPDHRLIEDSFYPIPPVFHWISPQDEINECREQLRNHRRRFNRKFQYVTGAVDDAEIEKFEVGGDGILIKINRPNAIQAIVDPPLGVALDKAVAGSSLDINELAGVTANARGLADRTTATEADYINTRMTIRENAERARISQWIGSIGRGSLKTIKANFALGTWAHLSSDAGEELMGVVQANPKLYQWVSASEFASDYDFRVSVDITSLSPAAREIEKKNYIDFLTLVTQFPQIAMSPTLIRETAYRCGYRNEKVIKEMQNMALLVQMGQMAGIQQSMQGGQFGQQQGAKMSAGSGIEQARQLQ